MPVTPLSVSGSDGVSSSPSPSSLSPSSASPSSASPSSGDSSRSGLGRLARCSAAAAALLLVGSQAGCELTDEILAPAEDVVVVEGLVQLRDDIDGQRVVVFLHRTVSGDRPIEVPGASVTVTDPAGRVLLVPETSTDECVAAAPDVDRPGTCYRLAEDEGLGLVPGDRLELTVRTAAGEELRSATTIPDRHTILTTDQEWCWIYPNTQLDLVWSPSPGAWAYFAEALLNDLDDAVRDEGIEVEEDPFYLTGVSVSSADTTIGFPGEFGVFDRGSIDTDLAVRLQLGVPGGVASEVAITAVDRNYTNWVRGGNFNPSGQVRIPSVRGQGTGYFGSAVVRAFQVFSIDLASPATRCVGAEPDPRSD